MSKKEEQMIKEMRQHLGKLHQKWRDDVESGTDDGHCKSNEGYVGLLYRLPNWFECASKEEYETAEPKLDLIEVYSYLFGPHRLHQFETVEKAHKEIMSW